MLECVTLFSMYHAYTDTRLILCLANLLKRCPCAFNQRSVSEQACSQLFIILPSYLLCSFSGDDAVPHTLLCPREVNIPKTTRYLLLPRSDRRLRIILLSRRSTKRDVPVFKIRSFDQFLPRNGTSFLFSLCRCHDVVFSSQY